LENIDDTQLDLLGTSTTRKHATQPNQMGDLSSGISERTFESQIAITLQPQPKIVEIPFECIVCEQSPDWNNQIVLTKCKHELCRKCLHEKCLDQMKWTKCPKCPICMEIIDQTQLEAIGISINGITNPEFSVNQDEFLTKQSYVGDVPLNIESKSNTALQLNSNTFECTICDKNIEPECGVILANCKHSLCRDCISDVILQQSEKKLLPNCPLCQKPITDEEVRMLDRGLHAIFVENRIDQDSSEGQPEKSYDVNENDFCRICDKTVEITILSFCKCRFCRICLTDALNYQSLINKMPTCPLCSSEVAGSNIYTLCGSDGFRRYMENKRIK
jgi:hypothetical protein